MKALFRNFKTYSPRKKIKFIVLFPVLVVAWLLDLLVEFGTFALTCMRDFIASKWKILLYCFGFGIMLGLLVFNVYRDGTVPEFEGNYQYEAECYVHYYGHQIANNFIVAVDGKVRGFKRPDSSNIARIVSVLDEYDIDREEDILIWLEQIQNQDYSNMVEFHNYCWEQLDGEVGYAEELANDYR